MRVLVCGGTGYIGSHTCLALLEGGHDPVILDNLSNSSEAVVTRLGDISGTRIPFENGDIRNAGDLDRVFRQVRPEAVLHFAAFKAVGESCARPLHYFDNNIVGSVVLLQAMEKHDVRTIVFSSSATVYGQPKRLPVTEAETLVAASPYGRTKIVVEQVIDDLVAHSGFKSATLRYFNPVGAHPSGRLGEAPGGEPQNLMPIVAGVAAGSRALVNIYGGDYPTRDGTAIRDYLHVVDLADAHVKALEYVRAKDTSLTVNLGTGRGQTVLEVVNTFSRIAGRDVPYRIVDRRPGDVAEVWADPARAHELLGWTAKHDLERMCDDTWRWTQQNPNGY